MYAVILYLIIFITSASWISVEFWRCLLHQVRKSGVHPSLKTETFQNHNIHLPTFSLITPLCSPILINGETFLVPFCSTELDSEPSPSSRPHLSFPELFHSRNIWKNICVLGFTSWVTPLSFRFPLHPSSMESLWKYVTLHVCHPSASSLTASVIATAPFEVTSEATPPASTGRTCCRYVRVAVPGSCCGQRWTGVVAVASCSCSWRWRVWPLWSFLGSWSVSPLQDVIFIAITKKT